MSVHKVKLRSNGLCPGWTPSASNDDVWRNLKQRSRRGADPDQASSVVQPDRGRTPIDAVGWNWDSIEPDPASASKLHDRSSAVGDHSVEQEGADEGVAPRRPARSHQPVARTVPRIASDDDLERMARELLFGLGDRSPGRSVGTVLTADAVDASTASGEPVEIEEVVIPLSEVAGVGSTVAERLALAGYDSAQALARITDGQVDDLAHEIGTFPARVIRWVEQARELTNH